jgi:ABC-type multidrug transport system fused ATPase/permease subunit
MTGKFWASGIFFAATLLLILMANGVGVMMHRLGTRSVEKVLFDIKLRIHHHINKLSLGYFSSERTGTIMTKAVGDVNNVSGLLRNSFHLTYVLVHLMISPILMMAMSLPLFLVTLLPMPLILIAFYRIQRSLKPMYKEQRENESAINSQIQEVLSGIKEIKAFNLAEHSGEIYREVNRRSYDLANRIMKIFSFNHQLQYGTKDLAMVLVVVTGGLMILTGVGGVKVGVVTSFLLLQGFLYNPLQALFGFYDVFQRGMVSMERIIDFLSEDPDVKDDAGAVILNRDTLRGQIAFKDICFHYDPKAPILKNINLQVRPGEKIALVGHSGSGKSTLISLLLRFYDPQCGSITIDGMDIRRFTQFSLRQHMGIVFQETFLFYGTIRENLMFVRPDVSEEAMIVACRIAHLHETIMAFPDQYNTRVGERGATLSGGQRQRLAIARVVLKDPSIVILDEATSAVDTTSERQIQTSIDAMLFQRTAFIIAHRLSTVRKCDRIVVMENGRIAEAGTHDELITLSGVYKQLCDDSTL